MVSIKSFFVYFFDSLCWIVAIILTLFHFYTYCKNEDVVDIQYKSFFSSQTYISYPEFSICFSIHQDNQFNDSLLPNDIRSKDLVEVLYGIKSHKEMSDERNIKLRQFLTDVSLNKALLYDDLLRADVKDMIAGDIMISEVPIKNNQDNTETYGYKIDTSIGTTNFRKTYENNRYRCWTRQLDLIDGQIIREQGISLVNGSFSRGIVNDVYISLHHKDQLIRGVHTMIRIADIMYFVPDPNKLPTLFITVTHIKMIIQRHNANLKCDRYLENDDEKFLQTVAKILNCIPLFWKDISNSWTIASNMSFCTKPSQYKQFWGITNHLVFQNYTPPCKKISITYDMSTKDDYPELRKFTNGELLIDIKYKTEDYEEVLSSKKFDAETTLSQVGGLLGIMIGFSFINIPKLFMAAVSKAKQTYTFIKRNDKNSSRNISTRASITINVSYMIENPLQLNIYLIP